jgi:hypothetical protein
MPPTDDEVMTALSDALAIIDRMLPSDCVGGMFSPEQSSLRAAALPVVFTVLLGRGQP